MKLGLAKLTLLLAASFFLGGCSISLRNDILQGMPINESPSMKPLFDQSIRSARAGLPAGVEVDNAPGVALISRQIEGTPLATPGARSVPPETQLHGTTIPDDLTPGYYRIDLPAPIGTTHFYHNLKGYDFLMEDSPLPPMFAQSSVVRALHASAKAAANATRAGPAASASDSKVKAPGIVKDSSLSFSDMVDFIKAILTAMNVDIVNQEVLNKITLQKQYHISSFEGLLFAYYESYFNGGFVDRTGQKYSKLQVTNSVSDDVIDSFTLVFLEAFFDYEICDGDLSVPVFYKLKDATKPDQSDNREWLVGDSQPTVALYIPKVQRLATDEDQELLTIVRFVSGRAGEGGKKLAGLAARTFAHIHVSFVVGANFAFGDNDTLTKFIDTLAQEVARRFTEAAMWQGLSWAADESRAVARVPENQPNQRIVRSSALQSLRNAYGKTPTP